MEQTLKNRIDTILRENGVYGGICQSITEQISEIVDAEMGINLYVDK